MGAYPDWYPVIRAARYLNVKAWELARQPSYWMHWGLAAEAAEAEAAALQPPSTIGDSDGGVADNGTSTDHRAMHYL